MQLLITGAVKDVANPHNFATSFTKALELAGIDLKKVSRVHRLSRAGFELAAIRRLAHWCKDTNRLIPVENHMPFDTSGGKYSRYVMHNEVLSRGDIDSAIVFTTRETGLDDHLDNVVYWLTEKGIPFVIATMGERNEEVSLDSSGLGDQAS